MNDKNQETEDLDIEDLREEEPFVRKVAKFSAFIYLGLAILVVIVAAVGIFSISYDDVSLPEISVSLPATDVSIPSIDERPVNHDVSGITADISLPADDPVQTESSAAVPDKPTYCRPVEGAIAKYYSMDALVFSKTMKDYRVHSGIDILAPVGSTVVAYTDGRVKSVTDDYFYGTTVEIEHAEGMTSCYMNLDPSLAAGIAEGAEVRTGQIIGTVGTSARIEQKDDPHLHFELKVNGKTIDPLTELPD